MTEFCKRYLDTAGDIAALGLVFLIVALLAGTLYALVEVWKRYKAPVPDAADEVAKGAVTGLPVKDLADALRELVVAIAEAPVWLALMAVGLLTFALAGMTIPAQCEMVHKKPAAPSAAVKPAPPALPAPAGTTG